ncbi:hypothetical protein SDC9_197525 [bioreactor metagenome]|uniref:Uncharacterized protein n=1 Tax=bioreactor metagenome TaxID=1076179 RepID=A0A645IF06_9ZZZZ
MSQRHGRLNFAHAIVFAAEEFAFAPFFAVAVGPPAGGGVMIALGAGEKPLVGGHQDAALPGPDHLVGVEADAAEIAPGAEESALKAAAASLRRILNHGQIAAAGDCHDFIHLRRQSEHMHRNHRLGAGCNRRLERRRIKRQRFVDVDDHRNRPDRHTAETVAKKV